MIGLANPAALIADTLDRGAVIEEAARQAVMRHAVDALNDHGLMAATAQGLRIGWLQIASLESSLGEISAGLRCMADAMDATIQQWNT